MGAEFWSESDRRRAVKLASWSSRLFGSSYKILEWEVPSCALVWMNWSVHFSLVSFHSFSWFEEKHHHPWLRPEIFVFTFPTWSFCEPCRILWTLQFCVLCPFFMMWGQVSHLTLGDSHQRNVMRFWCLSYLVISCYLGIFLFFWSRLDITWWSSPHLCYAGLPDWPQTVLLDIERYPEDPGCATCAKFMSNMSNMSISLISCTSPEDELNELNELNLHTIQRQSSPRHEVEPMDFGAVSPEFFWSFSYDLGDCTDMWCVILCDLVWLQDRNEHNYTSLTKLGSGLFVRNDLRCSQIQMPKSRKTFSKPCCSGHCQDGNGPPWCREWTQWRRSVALLRILNPWISLMPSRLSLMGMADAICDAAWRVRWSIDQFECSSIASIASIAS